MNPKVLHREIGLIDDALIIEAEKEKRSSPYHRRWLSIAACLAIVVAVVGVWRSDLLTPAPTTPDIVINDNSGDEYALTLNHASTAIAASRVIEGHFWQTLTSSELEAVFPTAHEGENSYTVTATANFSQTEAGIQLVDVIAWFTDKNGITAQVTTSPKEIVKCYLLDGKSVLSEISGVSIDAGYFDDTNNGGIIYYADFKLDDVYYYVELKGDKGEKVALSTLLNSLIAGGKADFTAITANPPPVLRNDSISLKEARADESFGALVPQNFPSDYALNEARRFVNQNNNYLSISLSEGMNNLRWKVSQFTDESRGRITSVTDTKNYDLSLYSIPMTESVPEELWEIVDCPIFRYEELTLEVVKARAYQISEAGDTNGWRMNFSVLYGYMLVEVSSKGLPPEVIFDLLTHVAPK